MTNADLLTALGVAGPNKVDLLALLTNLVGGAGAGSGARADFGGLLLRTHPDFDKSGGQVYLDRADYLVMDDGARVEDWADLAASITASGAGGLDTGAEAADTWYETYGIRKSSDGTKALLLHAAPRHYIDSGQQFTTTSDAQRALRLSTGTATDKLAQGVKFNVTGDHVMCVARLIRAGSVNGNIWFTLEGDTSGSPNGTPVATSDKIPGASISTSEHWVALLFRIPAAVVASGSTQWHLVLQGDYTRSDSVFIAWRGVAAGGHANGVAKEFNGSTWANASGVGDFNFQNYVLVSSAVTMPSGYDQRCLIGHVYNDGGTVFRPFIARDRVVRPLSPTATGTFTATNPLLHDLRHAFPPGPVVVIPRIAHGTADSVVRVFGIPDGFVGTDAVGSFGRSTVADSANPQTTIDPLITEVPFLYTQVSAGTGQVWVRSYTW